MNKRRNIDVAVLGSISLAGREPFLTETVCTTPPGQWHHQLDWLLFVQTPYNLTQLPVLYFLLNSTHEWHVRKGVVHTAIWLLKSAAVFSPPPSSLIRNLTLYITYVNRQEQDNRHPYELTGIETGNISENKLINRIRMQVSKHTTTPSRQGESGTHQQHEICGTVMRDISTQYNTFHNQLLWHCGGYIKERTSTIPIQKNNSLQTNY